MSILLEMEPKSFLFFTIFGALSKRRLGTMERTIKAELAFLASAYMVKCIIRCRKSVYFLGRSG